MTKQFTAAAILLLAEDGKIKLDDPVSRYYPGSPPTWSKITLRQLMGHRSGILNPQFMPGFMALQNPTPVQMVDFMRATPLEFEPGSKFAYGNAGPMILGYIIEQVTGRPYGEFIDARIFKQLGMTSSGYDLTTSRPSDAAVGYMPIGGVSRPAPLLPASVLYAAGGLYSTTNDMLKWDQALYDGRLLSETSRRTMLIDAEGDGYGLGLFAGKLEGRTATYAGGASPGFLAMIQRFTDDRATVIVLSNTMATPLEEISYGLTRLYFGLPNPAPPVAVSVDLATLDRYVGVFELFPGGRVTITRQGSTLMMRQVGTVAGPPMVAAVPLTAVSETVFVGPDVKIIFPSADAGPAPNLSFTVPRLRTERPAHRVTAE